MLCFRDKKRSPQYLPFPHRPLKSTPKSLVLIVPLKVTLSVLAPHCLGNGAWAPPDVTQGPRYLLWSFIQCHFQHPQVPQASVKPVYMQSLPSSESVLGLPTPHPQFLLYCCLFREAPLTLWLVAHWPLRTPTELCASLITHSHPGKVLFNCILIFLDKVHKQMISMHIIYEKAE